MLPRGALPHAPAVLDSTRTMSVSGGPSLISLPAAGLGPALVPGHFSRDAAQ